MDYLVWLEVNQKSVDLQFSSFVTLRQVDLLCAVDVYIELSTNLPSSIHSKLSKHDGLN
jgi:hypothetical protein